MQHNKYVKHQYLNMYCATKQFPEMYFIGPHNKPHVLRGLGKYYHMRFYPKLGHGICAIRSIPCVFTP